MAKTCEYEGKRADARNNIAFVSTCRMCTAACCFGELFVFFILAGKTFSEVFTTYSHALCSRLRQRA
jgi:hypothetical protein